MKLRWPALAALLLALVLIPSGCLLWLMQNAMRGQEMAAQARLREAYAAQIPLLGQRLDAWWMALLARLDEGAATLPPAALFARAIDEGLADAAVPVGAGGRILYPAPQPAPSRDPLDGDPAWSAAARLEATGPAAALLAYEKIPGARSLQAQVRCLMRLGRPREAARRVAAARGFDRDADLQGRLIVADLELLALRADPALRPALLPRLQARLQDYRNPAMGSPQRLFLWSELAAQGAAPPPYFAAERLALQYLEAPARAPVSVFASPGGGVLALMREGTIQRHLDRFAREQRMPEGVTLSLAPPGTSPGAGVLAAGAAGTRLAGRRIELRGALPRSRDLSYAWAAFLAIAAMGLLALLVGGGVRRQIQLARLRTDLVATVSHELKTPVASIGLLVETLLESGIEDRERTREYLQLIARENTRLARLVENFLTFSRIERDRQRFEFAPTRPEDVAREAAATVRERFAAPGCALAIEVESGIPPIRADRDYLVTALLNLLDNAWKYSGDEKRIALRVYRADAAVHFEVRDNGIGIAPRETRKIFRKFYQVDSRLARESGGCGLGLTVVEHVVKAHGGEVRVESRPGEGSAFTLSFPAMPGSRTAGEAAA